MNTTSSIKAISNVLNDNSCVRALFLSGSYGAGLEDEFSDIDFLAVVASGQEHQFVKSWRSAIGLIGEVVLWRERRGESLLINVITQAWLRVDVQIISAEQISGRAKDGLKVLFDHDALFHALPETQASQDGDAGRMRWQIEEFIRVLGLLPVAMGRGEHFNAMTGVFHLRNLLVDLLIAETNAPHRGGALHLNRLISAEQKKVLASLPPLAPTREAMITAHIAYAATYLPRAQKMAVMLGVEWSRRFELATWKHLNDRLGIAAPYSLA